MENEEIKIPNKVILFRREDNTDRYSFATYKDYEAFSKKLEDIGFLSPLSLCFLKVDNGPLIENENSMEVNSLEIDIDKFNTATVSYDDDTITVPANESMRFEKVLASEKENIKDSPRESLFTSNSRKCLVFENECHVKSNICADKIVVDEALEYENIKNYCKFIIGANCTYEDAKRTITINDPELKFNIRQDQSFSIEDV